MSANWFKKIKTVGESLCPPVLAPHLKRLIRVSPFARGRMQSGPCTEVPQGGRILEEAWQHLVAANAAPRALAKMPASPRWEMLLERIRLEISFFGSPLEAIHFAQSRIDFDHREPVYCSWQLYQLHAETLLAEFPQLAPVIQGMGDSPLSRPDSLLNCGGRLVSNVLFYHLRLLCQCLARVPKTDLVCEIGGGYGAPARLWLTNPVRPAQTYVIVDFPESLFFAETFLRANLQDLSLHYVTSATPLDPLHVARQRVVLCPIHLSPALASLSLDLVINTGSMQEMTEEWIDLWMEWLARQDCRWFYSMNYFGQPLECLMETGNMWSPRLSPEWTARLLRYDPALMRQQSTRNFAELLAEKVPGQPRPSLDVLRARYEITRQRQMDNETLMEVLDILRFELDETMCWDALQRIMAETRPLPKEAFFLAEHLTRRATAEFQARHCAQLAGHMAQLRRVRAGGMENTYSA
jgi:putative sugar O-methyltransferase